MRPPDVEGRAGRGWQVAMPESGPVDWQATVSCWLVNVPGAHPFWAWWSVSILHLRPIEGGTKPAYKQYPDAEYEFLIAAINPEYPEPDPDDPGPGYHFLTPIDVVVQFGGLDDAGARKLCEMAAAIIVRGRASPDQDWREWWERAIPNAVQHVALGGHPRAST